MRTIFGKVMIVLLPVILILNYRCESQPGSNLRQVVIIRHAEKPDKGDNLSCQGFNRALALPAVLYAKYKLPDHIFVADIKSGKSTNQARMYQTIVPFAIKYNLDIDTRYAAEDVKALVEAIQKSSGYVLVVWEHNGIEDLVQKLGVENKDLKWKDSDYDSIWIVTFKDGKAVLNVDKENINPGTACK